MKNFVKANLKKLIISSLAILCPIIFGLLFWNKLPEVIATHYGFSGEADGFSGRGFAVFCIPLFLLALHWLCMLITALDKKNKEQNPKVFGMIFWLMPLISIYVSTIIYSGIFGTNFNVGTLTFSFMGLLFIVIGNYLPKCKQNSTIGIKLSWTLANEENWNATHRLGGKIWFIGGFFILFLSFLPTEIGFIAFIPISLIMVLIPTVYSYVYYKNQLKNGNISAEDTKKVSVKKNTLVIIITLVFVAITLAFCLFICFTGDIEFEYADDSLTIKADYFDDMAITYAEIDSVEYRETDTKGHRVYGFGTPRLLIGAFKNDEFGSYTRYSYAECDSCVVITADGKKLVISGIDDKETSEIYNILIEKCN